MKTFPAGEHPKRGWALYASHLSGYMRRWILWSPFGTARVHNILRSDDGRDFHDHPFSFVSIILRGGYIEHRPGCVCGTWAEPFAAITPCRHYGPGSIVRRRAEDLHRLELLSGSAWTLVFSTRYFRAWGFKLGDGTWVPHAKYNRSYYRDSHAQS